ncbi:MAG TPA: signal recognition particle-docking protein FtsY [Lactobacillaceae bacterium]|jgi:fused signal recognition particle receptor
MGLFDIFKTKQAEPEAVEEVVETDKAAYDAGLSKTRASFSDRFNRFLANFRTVDEDFFEALEETLIGADVGFDNTIKISDALRDEVRLHNANNPDKLREVIVEKMVELYELEGQNEDTSMHFAPTGPTIILFVGVNGVGKTTTVGKLAAKYTAEGKKVLLAAADTFRAGATQQLQEWGKRADVPVVAGPEKADPASVVFEAVTRARDENFDVLFVDTAGRLQNNVNLMNELEKMKRIIQREIPDAPHEVLLVLDATTGQNALQQAKLFKDSSDVTGIVLTKLDGTAKGGIVLAIRGEMHLPVKWVGLGEKATDLRAFDSEEFAYSLFKGLL